MVKVVVLDSGPLGLLANPNPTQSAVVARQWASDLIAGGHRMIIPEIADYELRRELLRTGAVVSVALLDSLANTYEYAPLTKLVMRRAAELWAMARQSGQPTAGDKTIDADMILIAQAQTLQLPNTIIATSNVGHLSRFFATELWSNISP